MIYTVTTTHMILIVLLGICALLCTGVLYRRLKKGNVLHNVRTGHYGYFAHHSLPLLLLAIVFFTLAVLQPAWGTETMRVESRGADVLFALDVSKSMRATDMRYNGKTLDRITASKLVISNMVREHPEHRYGLVLFAGDAFVSSPLTTDTSAFLTFLQDASPDDVTTQGTDLASALRASLNRVTASDEDKRARVIVLISDGGEAMDDTLTDIAQKARDASVRIYTLGVGGEEGAPIPEGRDVFGVTRYKTYRGKPVYSKLNEAPLRYLAKQTGGEYLRLKQGGDIHRITQSLSALPTDIVESTEHRGRAPRYQPFLLIGLLFLLTHLYAPLIIPKLHVHNPR